jgi:hypothetical protein
MGLERLTLSWRKREAAVEPPQPRLCTLFKESTVSSGHCLNAQVSKIQRLRSASPILVTP